MSIWGKIIGGAAGMALHGPLGAMIGAAAGHVVDTYVIGNDRGDATAPEPEGDTAEPAGREGTRQIAFTIAVIVLGAKMAKADGVVTRD